MKKLDTDYLVELSKLSIRKALESWDNEATINKFCKWLKDEMEYNYELDLKQELKWKRWV